MEQEAFTAVETFTGVVTLINVLFALYISFVMSRDFDVFTTLLFVVVFIGVVSWLLGVFSVLVIPAMYAFYKFVIEPEYK
jgi:type IV secretory pathway TrbL component